MFIAVIDHLKQESKLFSGWLPPIALKAEALCHARRYSEAEQIAQMYPSLTVGRNHIRLQELIARERQSAEELTPSLDIQDYSKILQIFSRRN